MLPVETCHSPVGPCASPRGPRAFRLTVIALVFAASALAEPSRAESRLPDIGEAAGEALSRAEENRLRDAFWRQIRKRLRLVEDPEIADYITSLGQRIAGADPDREYRFLVVDTPTVNAFAGPGGIIAVNAGLVTLTESESELAAVLAHEIAHVTQRHLARLLDRSQLGSLAALASVLAAIAISTQDVNAGQAVLAAGIAGTQQSALKYSRANEREADRTGMVLLDQAGFDPKAMPEFFERFQDWQRFTSTPPEFLSSHPVTVARIADTRGRAEPRSYRESAEYDLMRAKLRLRLSPSPDAARTYFEARVESGEGTESDRYGLALALAALNRPREALPMLRGLMTDFPRQPAHRVAAARALTATGDEESARNLLAESVERFPDHSALGRDYAFSLIQAGKPDEAVEVLRHFERRPSPDSGIHRLLGLAHQRAGRRAASHMALAEFHHANGDIGLALRQLDLALEDPAIGAYREARASARRDEIRREREQLRSRR